MNNQKIYAIQEKQWDELYCVHAIFDSQEKAEKFLTRFKTKQDLRVVELILNPDYISDPDQDPYNVDLKGTQTIPKSVSISTFPSAIEDALVETCLIETCLSEDVEDAHFNVDVFAKNREEAINKAIKVRDAAIEGGDWYRAHREAIEEVERLREK